MVKRFVAIDLAALAETRKLSFDTDADFETVKSDRMSDFVVRMRNAGHEYDVENLETDPAVIIEETGAYFEILTRQYVRDTGRAVLLPTAVGDDLDYIVSRLGVQRLEGEDDARLRTRYLLALEAFSTAGPEGAYVFHAMTATTHLRDVAVYGPETGLVDPGQVGIYCLSTSNSGSASNDLLSLVRDACNAKDVRPLTDEVIVSSASPLAYNVEVNLQVGYGPDPTPFVEEAKKRLISYVTRRHMIGSKVTLAGLSGAAHVDGVEDAIVVSPNDSVIANLTQAPWCSSLTVTWEHVDV